MQPRTRIRTRYQKVVTGKPLQEKIVKGEIHRLPDTISKITKFYISTSSGVIKFQCNKGVADYVGFLSLSAPVLVEYIEREDNVCVALFVKEIE